MSDAGGAPFDRWERTKLESLRPRFEKLGYVFEVEPPSASLPAFMEGWRPDAVATRGNDNVAVEVKRSSDVRSGRLNALHARFANQTGWRLAIVTGGVDPANSTPIPAPKIDSIRQGERDIERLIAQGHTAAALVMAFALLEATARIVSDDGDRAPQQVGSVVQALAIDGLLEPSDEHRLHLLGELRSRVVHGGLDDKVTPEDARMVLAVIPKLLTAAFAE